MPEYCEHDPWLSGEPEEHFSEADLQAARQTFHELGRIHEEEGIRLE
jgi:hypothetical protein